MLKSQVTALLAWRTAVETARQTADDRDRGEVTAQTALIVLLVGAAIAAGGIIAARITGAAESIPTP